MFYCRGRRRLCCHQRYDDGKKKKLKQKREEEPKHEQKKKLTVDLLFAHQNQFASNDILRHIRSTTEASDYTNAVRSDSKTTRCRLIVADRKELQRIVQRESYPIERFI